MIFLEGGIFIVCGPGTRFLFLYFCIYSSEKGRKVKDLNVSTDLRARALHTIGHTRETAQLAECIGLFLLKVHESVLSIESIPFSMYSLN